MAAYFNNPDHNGSLESYLLHIALGAIKMSDPMPQQLWSEKPCSDEQLFERATRDGLASVLRTVCAPGMLEGALATSVSASSSICGAIRDIYRKELECISSRLHGAQALLLKQSDSIATNTNQSVCFAMNDLEILLRAPDAKECVKAFHDCGWSAGVVKSSELLVMPLRPVEVETTLLTGGTASFHKFVPAQEMADWLRALPENNEVLHSFEFIDDDVYYLLGCSLYSRVGNKFELSDLWNYSQPVLQKAFGESVRCQSPSDAFWLRCTAVYYNVMLSGDASLRPFVELLVFLGSKRGLLDWDRIIAMAKKYDLVPCLYYVCAHLREIDLALVPESAALALEQEMLNGTRNGDFGDFVPKLFRCFAVTALPRILT